MKRNNLCLILLIGTIFISACSRNSEDIGATETAIAGSIFATWTAAAPLNTLAATTSPLPSLTPTSSDWLTPTPFPQARVKSQGLNVREGPGTDYLSMELLSTNTTLVITGQTAVCNWLKVITPSGTKGWVSGGDFYVEMTTPCDQIPEAPFRPVNGSVLLDYRTYEGAGVIRITNPLAADVVVILTNMSRMPVLAVYMRSGDQYIVEGLPESTYELFLDVGNDWLGDQMVFEESLGRFQVIDLYNITAVTIDFELMISTESSEASPVEEEFPALLPQ